MKTLEKKFDAVQFMRQQRDRLNEILLPMSKEEIVAYFKQREIINRLIFNFYFAVGDSYQ